MCKKLIYPISFVLVLGLVPVHVAKGVDLGLVGWWKFDEGSGTTAYDSSGNGHDGTFMGDPQWVAGKFGGALEFDGSADLVNVPDDFRLDFLDGSTPTFTVEFWFKTTGVGTGTRFMGGPAILDRRRRGKPTSVQFHFMIDLVGKIRFCICDDNSTTRLNIVSTTIINDGFWHHAAGVRDGTSNWELYVDGNLEASSSTTMTASDGYWLSFGARRRDGDSIISYYNGKIDDIRIYSQALTQAEIQRAMQDVPPGAAFNPSPAHEATDVPRQVALSWTPGDFAGQHDVYFGTSSEDVNNATNLDPMGPDKVYRARQGVNSYAVPEALDLGQTYYWRIDEVNAPPTSHVVFKGDVWSFTTEPFVYAVENITATASSSDVGRGPENTVNGSGLDDNDLHSIVGTDMWLSGVTGPQPSWIQFEFDKVYKLREMWVWNYNEFMEPLLGLGFKDVSIEYSVDGNDYTPLGTTHEFAQGPGTSDYAHNTTVDFGGLTAKYARLTANSNWRSMLPQYGLSEVHFLYILLRAREPSPDSGATDVDPDVVLSWKAGREAAEHDVYLSTDEQAVIDGSAPVTTVTEAKDGPLSLDLGKTYYWRVDEVNEAETPTTLPGDVWNFTTQEYFVLDDFESYNDLDPDDPNSNRIFKTWIDGFEQPANGSVVGYPEAPFAETTIVHSGSQSAPLYYDNTAGATYSEATRTVDTPRDWTKNGIKALTLWFYGDPNNSATEQLYVKVNGSKVTYYGDAENLRRTGWQLWYIDLADLGVNMANVTELTIGLERDGVVGGKGVVYFDDIRLSPYDRQLVTPAEPDQVGLVAHWQFDEGSGTTAADSSGNSNDGTLNGNPQWVAGKIGGALDFDGSYGYVNVPDDSSLDFLDGSTPTFTVEFWFKTTGVGTGTGFMGGPAILDRRRRGSMTAVQFHFMIDSAGRLGFSVCDDDNITRVSIASTTKINDGFWHHGAGIRDGTSNWELYIDGNLEASSSTTVTASDGYWLTFGARRRDNSDITSYFNGKIDDIRIYDRLLSQEEIAWLAGRTKPFDRPL